MSEWICKYYASHEDIPKGHVDGEIVGKLVRCSDCVWNMSGGEWVECSMSGMYGRKASENYCSCGEKEKQ